MRFFRVAKEGVFRKLSDNVRVIDRSWPGCIIGGRLTLVFVLLDEDELPVTI
jgi:hypothetical protein